MNNKFLCRIFKNKSNKPEWNEFEMKFASLKYWTGDLIEWVSRENDPLTLACTAQHLNGHRWPHWLPSKPTDYDNRQIDIMVYFSVDLLKMLEKKAECICPGLCEKVQLTGYYWEYEPKNTFLDALDALVGKTDH